MIHTFCSTDSSSVGINPAGAGLPSGPMYPFDQPYGPRNFQNSSWPVRAERHASSWVSSMQMLSTRDALLPGCQ